MLLIIIIVAAAAVVYRVRSQYLSITSAYNDNKMVP